MVVILAFEMGRSDLLSLFAQSITCAEIFVFCQAREGISMDIIQQQSKAMEP